MKKLLYLLIVLAVLATAVVPVQWQIGKLSLGAGVVSADGEGWYNPDWLYRKSKLITAADSSIADFTVTGGATPLVLHTGNGTDDADDLYFNEKCKNYFDDVRVTEADGTTEIPCYLRNVTSSQADLCIQTDVSTSSKTVYIYYGNSLASRASDLNATFISGEWEREGAGNVLTWLAGNYTAHSGLCRLHDGTLLSTFSRGTGHISNDSKVYYSKSTDQGRTWSTATEFYDHASYAPNGVVPAEILIGEVYHIIVSLQVVNSGSMYDANRKVYIIVSVDGGTTWGGNSPDYDDGNLILVGGTGADDDARGVRDRVIEYTQSDTQKLGLATYNHAGSGGTVNGRVYFNWCPAGNLTDWTEVFVSDEGDGENGAYEFAEPVIVQTKDGGVFDGDFYMATLSCASPYNIRRIISTDYGATWGNNTPTYDDGLTAASGLTQDVNDSIDIIRLSTGSLVCAYMYYASANDGELRLVKPSAEDVDITWDTTNYSQPWRYRLTMALADFGYPSIAEITDGGQIGVSFYLGSISATAIQFHYVPLGSFVGNRFSHTSTMKISCIGGGTWADFVRIIEGTTEAAIAQKYINPSVTKFWVEYRMYSTSQGTDDQQYFMGTDGTPITDRLFGIITPLNTDQNDIYYRSAATNYALTANDYVEGTTYRFRILVNEADSLISYYMYDDAYALLYSATNKAYSAGSPTDLDYLQLGSSASAGQAFSNWYGIQLRKYAATEPTWSTTGAEESPDISNTPSSWSVNSGTPVQPSSVYSTGLDNFTFTNLSSFPISATISGGNATGGTPWVLSDTATPASNVFGMRAGVLTLPTTIQTAASSSNLFRLADTSQRKFIYAASNYWVVYGNSTHVVYRVSTDWNTENILKADGAGSGDVVSIWVDSSDYLSYAIIIDSDPNLYYRRGLLNGNGTITWSANEQIISDTTRHAYYPYISVDSDGLPWISYSSHYDLETYMYVTHSTTGNGTWTTDTVNNFPYLLETKDQNHEVAVFTVPLSTSKVYCLYVYQNGGLTSGGICGRLWNGSWGGVETLTGITGTGTSWENSIVADGDDVYVTWKGIIGTNATFYSKKRTYGVGWGSQETIKAFTGWRYVQPILSIDSTSHILYCFWIDTPTQDNHIYYKKRQGSSWDTNATDWLTDTTDASPFYTSSFYGDYGNRIGIVWESASGGTHYLKYGILDLNYNIVVRQTPTYNYLTTSLPAGNSTDWGIALWTPTNTPQFDDGYLKTILVVLAAEAAD